MISGGAPDSSSTTNAYGMTAAVRSGSPLGPAIDNTLWGNQRSRGVAVNEAASEVYAPVSGEVVAANADLAGDPSLVNSDPQGKAWFMKIKLSNKGELDGLMDTAAYEKFVAGAH